MLLFWHRYSVNKDYFITQIKKIYIDDKYFDPVCIRSFDFGFVGCDAM
jgi:hypothetical protein